MLPLLRFTLDLFDTSVPVGETQPPLQESKTSTAEFSPGLPIAQVAGRAKFEHPRANRVLHLTDAEVSYKFTRARRRTIGFVVGPDGLSVRAPHWTPLLEVEAALQEKGRWIVRKLQESQDRTRRMDALQVVWSDGVVLPYLGGNIRVMLDPAHGFSGKGAELVDADQCGLPSVLHVGLPHSAGAAQIRDAVQAWLMQQAQTLFKERLDHFATKLGVRWSRLRLSSAGTRWGSASADGSIRLNWRLIHLRLPVIDYVVAHELAHLRVMNHSPQFWDTVATVLPDYAELRSQLKSDAIPKW